MQEKNQQEKAAAERQVELLSKAFDNAHQNNGVWLNVDGKKQPAFYQKHVTISPFNALILGLHSDQNNYKTNQYTLFSEAKKRGESVQSKEKGVPFLWYNWNEYQNKNNPEDKISRADYQALPQEKQANYKGIRSREVRTLFNIEQTTLPMVDKTAYAAVLKETGKMEERGDVEGNSKAVRDAVEAFSKNVNDNLVEIRPDTMGVANYDSKKDVILLPKSGNFEHINDYARALVEQAVVATGSLGRLSREGAVVKGGKSPSEDAVKQERLVVELATAVKLQELGISAKLSPESMKMTDYWKRELQENPCLIDAVERDINNSLDMLHKAERGEKVEKRISLGSQQAESKLLIPKHYYVADEIKTLPNKDTKDVVIVRDPRTKMADVVLPSGAGLGAENDIPGMNKSRFEHVLNKEGYDTVTFYNVDGSYGYRPDDSFFDGKDVSVSRLKGWNIEDITKLDVSDAIKRSGAVDFDKVLMLRDDEGKWALYMKPENEKAFSVYPDKADVNTFFVTLKQGNEENSDQMRQEMATKYYVMANDKPEMKVDIFKSKATAEELAKIERVNIFKTKETAEKPSVILCMPTINGEKQKPREVNSQQWQRMWLSENMQDYKMHLAASLFADVLRQSKNESVAVSNDKQEQENETENKNQAEHTQYHEDLNTRDVEKDKQELELKYDLNVSATGKVTIQSYNLSVGGAPVYDGRHKWEFDSVKDALEVLKNPANKMDKVLEQVGKELQTRLDNEKNPELSPLLKQFYDLKKKHPDALLLFRTGDFYETYCKDAENASRILGITLTKSSRTMDKDGKPLQMAGFPYHALDTYLPKLIRAGQRVAICDQIEDPRQKIQRGSQPEQSANTPKEETGKGFHR